MLVHIFNRQIYSLETQHNLFHLIWTPNAQDINYTSITSFFENHFPKSIKSEMLHAPRSGAPQTLAAGSQV
jgi:hypothetical protein